MSDPIYRVIFGKDFDDGMENGKDKRITIAKVIVIRFISSSVWLMRVTTADTPQKAHDIRDGRIVTQRCVLLTSGPMTTLRYNLVKVSRDLRRDCWYPTPDLWITPDEWKPWILEDDPDATLDTLLDNMMDNTRDTCSIRHDRGTVAPYLEL